MVTRYVPDRGDLAWFNFDPTLGHEQGGRRPAVVLSAQFYNASSGLALVCPATKKIKDYPFEVPILTTEVSGVVLVDQLRVIDWKIRKMSKLGKISDSDLEVIQKKVIELVLGVNQII
jgi:mRNA interferase MazF